MPQRRSRRPEVEALSGQRRVPMLVIDGEVDLRLAADRRAPRVPAARDAGAGRPTLSRRASTDSPAAGSHPALGDQRGDQRGRGDVEGRVAAAVPGGAARVCRRPGDRSDLVGVALLDHDLGAGRALAGRSSRSVRRRRTGSRPRRRRARGRRCRPCWPRPRWPRPDRSPRSPRRRSPAAIRPGGGPVDDQLVLDPESPQLVDGQPGALQQRARLGRRARRRAAARWPARRPPPGPCPARGPPARPCCSGSGSRRRPASRSAPWRGHGVAGGLLLGVDRAGLGQRRGGLLAGRARRPPPRRPAPPRGRGWPRWAGRRRASAGADSAPASRASSSATPYAAATPIRGAPRIDSRSIASPHPRRSQRELGFDATAAGSGRSPTAPRPRSGAPRPSGRRRRCRGRRSACQRDRRVHVAVLQHRILRPVQPHRDLELPRREPAASSTR